MKLKVGKWYYFEIMGEKNFLYVYNEKENEYKVEHFFEKRKDGISFDREKSYINKTSRTLNSYQKINQKEIIEEIFT